LDSLAFTIITIFIKNPLAGTYHHAEN
jgi:hypothetical protein